MSAARASSGLALIVILIACAATPASAMPDSSTAYHAITGISPTRVAAGDVVTIRGVGFPLAPWRTRLEVDGQEIPLQHFKIVSPAEIHLTLQAGGASGTSRVPGEREHSVVVWVDEQPSNTAIFTEIGWGVVTQPRVFIPILVYLVLLAGTLLLQGGGLFLSATGNLSLSKIQMGIWILLFSFSYVLLASIWRDFIPVTPGMLWLLGISSATAVGAKVIAKKNDPDPPLRSRASRICSEIHPTLGTYKCEIHRCQAMLWTLIVLVVYAVQLISTMHLPDIPGVLLILMGVGSGTYLGFKYPKTVVRARSESSARRPEQSAKVWRKRPRRRPSGTSSGTSSGASNGDKK
ncbi:MAG: IPT/TIG domain-containing protein [Candidatus Eisenbacteria sp.]|nr:IPT/TIG domain-containing protein [Candidatus Eisenbacteria bacterium]